LFSTQEINTVVALKQQQFLKLYAFALLWEVKYTKKKKERESTETDDRSDDYWAMNIIQKNPEERKKEAGKPLYLNRYE